MSSNVSDEAFARYINQVGNATLDQIDAAKAEQARLAKGGVLMSLGDVLVKQGILTAAIRENIEKKLLAQQQGGIKQLAQFKLIKKLGEGGMGAVYLADDLNVGRSVAVKVLPKKHAGDVEFVTRFRREAKAAGQLNHVNIVSAYSYGEDQGYQYLAMEYCEGEPLDKILKRDGPLPWDKAIQIVMQIARGLKHAHEHNFVHRDIKPANVMLCKPLSASSADDVGVAKILDMGLSKNIGSTEQSFNTQTGVALGTPHYISPEQARGDRNIDGRSDIYSLGATFYHLVTGRTPFEGTTAAAVMLKHLNEQLPNPQDVREDVPDAVVHVIQRMMAKDAKDRYCDCQELLTDLELVVDGKMPSSKAVEHLKSSIAMKRVRAPALHAADHARKPAGTRQHAPVAAIPPAERKRTESAPGVANKKRLYIGGAAAVSVLILMIAMFGGGRNRPASPAQSEIAASSAETKTAPAPVAPEKKMPVAAPPAPAPAAASDPREDYAQHLLDTVNAEEKQGTLSGDALRQRLTEIARNHDSTKAGKEAAERLKALPAVPVLSMPATAPGGVDDAWVKTVQALPRNEQGKAVAEKLKELNPGFSGIGGSGDGRYRIEGLAVSNIAPLRALTQWDQIHLNRTQVADLSPLKGLRLSELHVGGNLVRDLSPLHGMPLRTLMGSGPCNMDQVGGMKLGALLWSGNPEWTDLSVLAGMPLSVLHCQGANIRDFSPLKALPLKEIRLDFDPVRNGTILRSIKTLEKINDIPVAEFWAKNPVPVPVAKPESPGAVVYLSDLPEQEVKVFINQGHALWAKNGGSGDLAVVVNKVPSPKGLFLHPANQAPSHVAYVLEGKYQTFEASAAINDSASMGEHKGAVTALTFKVLGDGKLLWASQPTKETGKAQNCRVDVSGVRKLELVVECPGHPSCAMAVWVEPRLTPVGAPALPKGVLLAEDFEKLDLKKLPAGWRLSDTKNRGDYSIVDEPGRGKVLKISSKGDVYARLEITLDPVQVRGHIVRISAWAKFPGSYAPRPDPAIVLWARPRIIFRYLDKEGKEHYPWQKGLKPNAPDWQMYEGSGTVDKEAQSILVYLEIPLVAAEAFFDDLIVELDPDPNSKPPQLHANVPAAGDAAAHWAKALNLLPIIDVERDALDKTWVGAGEILAKPDYAQGTLEIPFHPADEYDCRVEFTPSKGSHWIAGSLFYNGERFWWIIDEGYAALQTINGKTARDQSPSINRSLMKPGERNTVMVQVRRNSVAFTVNGELAVTCNPEMGSLTARKDWPPRDTNTMALKALGAFVFHKIDLLEISGKGTFTRPNDPAAKDAEKKRGTAVAKPDADALPRPGLPRP